METQHLLIISSILLFVITAYLFIESIIAIMRVIKEIFNVLVKVSLFVLGVYLISEFELPDASDTIVDPQEEETHPSDTISKPEANSWIDNRILPNQVQNSSH